MATATTEPTTGQRTHRALRLALAFVVFALFAGVLVQLVADGGTFRPSISHYFYSPAHNIFVAALVAASLALIALTGRDIETVFLDLAAVFAPLIAFIPTGLATDSPEGLPCDGNDNCV